MTQHTLSVLLQDGAAGLHRASSLLRRGAVSVSSLTLAASGTPGILQMTLTVDHGKAPTVARHLGSLVEVISVRDVTPTPSSVAQPTPATKPGAAVGASLRDPSVDLPASQGGYLYRAQADGVPGDDFR